MIGNNNPVPVQTFRRRPTSNCYTYVCMYVCMYVYMYVYIYIYVYIHTYIHIYIINTHIHSVYICIYIYVYILPVRSTYVCMYVCMYTYTHIHITCNKLRMYVCMYVCVYTHTHMSVTYVCCINAHTHTYLFKHFGVGRPLIVGSCKKLISRKNAVRS